MNWYSSHHGLTYFLKLTVRLTFFFFNWDILALQGFPGGSDSKESACNAGHPDSVPGLGRYPGEGNGHPLQYSCLGNAMDGGSWQAAVRGITELNMTEQLMHSCSTVFASFCSTTK